MLYKDMDMTKGLLTVKEVAGLLRVDRNTVYRWLHNGKLSKISLFGGHVRIRKSEIDSIIGESNAERCQDD